MAIAAKRIMRLRSPSTHSAKLQNFSEYLPATRVVAAGWDALATEAGAEPEAAAAAQTGAVKNKKVKTRITRHRRGCVSSERIAVLSQVQIKVWQAAGVNGC